MNSSLNTLERPSSSLHVAPVLSQNGFACSLVTLDAGAESVLPASPVHDDQLLVVLEGDLAVSDDSITTLVNSGAAMLLPGGKSPVLSSPTRSTVRLLRVEVPPRQVITPQIITPGS